MLCSTPTTPADAVADGDGGETAKEVGGNATPGIGKEAGANPSAGWTVWGGDWVRGAGWIGCAGVCGGVIAAEAEVPGIGMGLGSEEVA